MFDVGFGEALVLGVLALLIFGPQRLPEMAAQAGRALRQLRELANNARSDLRDGLGPEFKGFDPADLDPRRFVRKHLWEDDEPGGRTGWKEPAGSVAGSGGPAYAQRPPFDRDAT